MLHDVRFVDLQVSQYYPIKDRQKFHKFLKDVFPNDPEKQVCINLLCNPLAIKVLFPLRSHFIFPSCPASAGFDCKVVYRLYANCRVRV